LGTGGASQSVGSLLSMEGASATVLEVRVPYAMQAQDELLGRVPEKYVCCETARDLARLAYVRAVHLTRTGSPVVGLGVECSLVSGRPKRGLHQCFVVAYSSEQVTQLA
jgi:hypothetical protein